MLIHTLCFAGCFCCFWPSQSWSFWWARRTCNQRSMYL